MPKKQEVASRRENVSPPGCAAIATVDKNSKMVVVATFLEESKN